MLNLSIKEREKTQKIRVTKRNLKTRQQKLLALIRRNKTKFRQNAKAQVELRRVVALCTKLGERLNGMLEEELVRKVMES